MNAWICVYRDTIEEHENDWNLTDIEVTEEFAQQYFEECIKESDCEWKKYDDFIVNYTADDTEDFYEYAKKYNAILRMKHWTNANERKQLLAYAEEIILSMGGNEADIEQITEEIKESGYTTIEEVKSHLENYYI